MWETMAPVEAWRAVIRRPWIFLVPLAWDLLKWGLARVMAGTGFYFARWDYTVGPVFQDGSLKAALLPPPALPSLEHLGTAIAPRSPALPSAWPLAVMLLMLALDSLVKAGFLNALWQAVSTGKSRPAHLVQGAVRYGWRLFALSLLWIGLYSGAATLVQQERLPESILIPFSLFWIATLAASEFVVVANDVWPPVAVLAVPVLLWHRLGPVLQVVLCSAAVSAGLTFAGSLLGTPWVVLPFYAALGSWLAAAALRAFCTEEPDPNELSELPPAPPPGQPAGQAG